VSATRHPTISVAGTHLAIHEWGEPNGRPLLFQHGLGHRAGLQINEVAPLLAAEEGFRVIAPDTPGFGGSPPARPVRPTELAELVPPLLDALGMGRVALMGFSWGATIGCHVAARHAGRLSALVLLDAGYADQQPGAAAVDMLQQIRRQWEEDCAPDRDALLERLRADGGRWSPAVEEAFLAGWHEREGRLEPVVTAERFADALRGVVEEPPSPTWPAIAASGLPVLLVMSDAARRDDVDRFRNALPAAHLEHVTGTGHDVCRERPREVAALVGDWLRALPHRAR
jgi:pimeloyl-ACP methyl ester carboxylesterase